MSLWPDPEGRGGGQPGGECVSHSPGRASAVGGDQTPPLPGFP